MEKLNNPKKSKNSGLSKHIRFNAQMDLWVGYWRANLHRFAEDLGVQLKTFQKLLIFMMDKFPMFMYVASRGTGKSFLIALYAILKCILYPNLIVVISSATRGQAILMIKQYVVFFQSNYPLIGNEIERVSTNPTSPECVFKNGSKIVAVTASDNSRGQRSHILILEEFAIMKKEIIDSVLKKFGTTPRQPAFLNLPKYADHPTEPIRELYISSARYKAEWGWGLVKTFFGGMIKEKRGNKGSYYGLFSSDWRLPVHFKLFDENKMRKELEAEGMDETIWSMEMDSLWFGENERSYYKFAQFSDNRTIQKADYPYSHDLFYGKKKKPERLKKKVGEIRVLSMDIASSPKKDSDNTILDYFSVIESSDGYVRNMKYSESMRAEKITEQALRVKQLWYDLNIDFIVLDAMNIGRELYALLTQTTYDVQRDFEYPPFVCFNDEEYKNWAYEKDGVECIYLIKGTADLNNDMARSLNANLNLKKIKFLIPDSEIKDNFVKSDDKYLEKPVEERLALEMPYIQTTMMVNEIINLEHEIINGKIKIKEVGRARKDRYSALAMGNYFISQIEVENLRHKETHEDWEVMTI